MMSMMWCVKRSSGGVDSVLAYVNTPLGDNVEHVYAKVAGRR